MLTEPVLRSPGYSYRFRDVDGLAIRHSFFPVTYSYTAHALHAMTRDERIRSLASILHDLREDVALGLDAGPRTTLGAYLAAEQGLSHLSIRLGIHTLFNLVAENMTPQSWQDVVPALSPLTNMRIDFVRWAEYAADWINERGGSV